MGDLLWKKPDLTVLTAKLTRCIICAYSEQIFVFPYAYESLNVTVLLNIRRNNKIASAFVENVVVFPVRKTLLPFSKRFSSSEFYSEGVSACTTAVQQCRLFIS